MKVKNLIEKLGELNPDLDVICYTEDQQLVPDGYGFRLLAIENVESSRGELLRVEGVPMIRFGDSTDAVDIVLLS